LTDEQMVQCPLCGKKVSADLDKCPFCATHLVKAATQRDLNEVIEDRVTRRLERVLPSQDFLRAPIPKTELPDIKVNCPACGVALSGGEAKCPRCGIPLSFEEIMLECPECGALVLPGAKSCPKCGVGFEEAPPEPGVPEIAPLPEELAPPREIQKPMREVVTSISPEPSAGVGRGLVNGRGVTNGTGLVNGTGMVNGTGLVNGTGKINGTRGIPRGAAPPMRRADILRKWQFLAVLVALVIVIPTFVYLSYSRESSRFNIDGNFDDWARAPMFGMRTVSGVSAVDVSEWSVGVDADRLYVYARTQANMMSNSSVNSFFLFVDSDNSRATGYQVGDIGAEYMLEIDGWNGTVQSSSVSSFPAGVDKSNWSEWQNIGSVSKSLAGTQLEAMATMPGSVPQSARFLLVSQDELERMAVSYPVTPSGGLLIVTQELSPSVPANGIVPSSSSTPLLRLNFTCQGSGGSVSQVVPELVGVSTASPVAGFSLTSGETSSPIDVSVDTSGIPSEQFISAFITSQDITSSFASVEILGDPASAYVGAQPASVAIDGAFGDWNGMTTPDVDSPLPIQNQNIDIDSVGNVNTTVSSYFFVSVSGEMCAGAYVPFIKLKPTGGGGGTVVAGRVAAPDVLRVYIDDDRSSTTGYVVSFGSKTIGADYKIEINGLDGRIVSTNLYQWLSGAWEQLVSNVDAAKDRHRIEVGVSASGMGGSSTVEFIIETTDWKDRADLAALDTLTVRAMSGGLPLSAGNFERWAVDSSTTSQFATAMSYQRKLFYDGTNFWSFFFDGSDTVYKYSTDAGVTWTSRGSAFVTTGVNEVSIWYDSANSVVYAVGDVSTASGNVYLQRGTVTPATSTIAWQGSDAQWNVSSFSLGGKNAFISRDANGYIWVLSSNKTTYSGNSYDLAAFKSQNTNDITNRVAAGTMGLADLNTNVKGSIVPAGTGSDMWAVYAHSGNVSARKYTGSWSSATDLYTRVLKNDLEENTDNSPPSVVVNSRGTVYVVFGDSNTWSGTSKPHIAYTFNTTSTTWNATSYLSGIINKDGYCYPTISLDSSTGNLFAFWINMSADNGIACKKKPAGLGWSTFSLGSQQTYTKQYLTSIYSVSGETLICWQWTQNTTGIQVMFDRIPEFRASALPIVCIMTMIFVCAAATRRGSRHDSA
jgi:hypothetical protein